MSFERTFTARFLPATSFLLAVVAFGCSHRAPTSGSGPTTSSSGAGGGGAAGAGTFDACGGRIVDPKTGMIDPAEYVKQARLWDRATIDCRLGPKAADRYKHAISSCAPVVSAGAPAIDCSPEMASLLASAA